MQSVVRSDFNDRKNLCGVTKTTTVADLVALGTTMSNNLCGGNNLPYRAGRIDAASAGSTTGVPAPETSLEETLVFFERAGFDTVDGIGLTACGHTLGSVHHVRTDLRAFRYPC
jgi:catalase (peroxidase I)